MKYLKIFEEYLSEPTISKLGHPDQTGGLIITLSDSTGNVIGNVSIESYDSGRVTDPDLESFHQSTQDLPYTDANTAYVHTLNISPEHRRMGHGSRLVKAGEEAARGFGKKYATAIVSCDNTNSQGLFGKARYSKKTSTGIKDLLHKEL